MSIVCDSLSQDDKRYEFIQDTVKGMDGFLVELRNHDQQLSVGHLLIDGYSCRVAEIAFHLALVYWVCISRYGVTIYIKGDRYV